jgi:putative NADH-flavin reductase
MEICVLGATGDTGRHVVESALEAGHEVIAFVRDPSKLERSDDERVRVVEGDAERYEDIERAVEGTDAVISALGQAEGSSKRLLSKVADHLVRAMEAHDLERLVTLTGAGVQMPGDESTLGRKFMRGMMKVLARDILEDAQEHADKISASDLAWTIVRPPRLTHGDRSGSVEAGYLEPGPTDRLSRADLAAFMVEQVEDETWVREAPMVVES